MWIIKIVLVCDIQKDTIILSHHCLALNGGEYVWMKVKQLRV